ncbi:MAG: hypothetical protein R2932_56810 [Caldilineaceae bacterium]
MSRPVICPNGALSLPSNSRPTIWAPLRFSPRLKLDDYKPYLFKTTDYGQSWERIDGSFPTYQGRTQITRIVREDPTTAGLLYVGSETGLYFSLDNGASCSAWRATYLLLRSTISKSRRTILLSPPTAVPFGSSMI